MGNTKTGYFRLITGARWVSHSIHPLPRRQLSEPLPSIHPLPRRFMWAPSIHPSPRRFVSSAKPRGNFPADLEWRWAEPGCLHSWAHRPVGASFPAISNAAWLKINVQAETPEGRLWNESSKRKQSLKFNKVCPGLLHQTSCLLQTSSQWLFCYSLTFELFPS